MTFPLPGLRASLLPLLVVMGLFGAFAPAAAKGPGIGEKIPHALVALDQDGDAQSFDALAGEKGLVVFFTRSADWCPYCQEQLISVNDRVGEFREKGYNVASISYDTPDKLKKFASKYEVQFPLLSDPDSVIIEAFGILNTEQTPGSFAYGIPYPGIFVVNADQTVQAKYFEEDYKERPSLDGVIENLK